MRLDFRARDARKLAVDQRRELLGARAFGPRSILHTFFLR
jgi:hypothetical protein